MKKLFLLFTIGLLFIGCKYSPSSDINDENITYNDENINYIEIDTNLVAPSSI